MAGTGKSTTPAQSGDSRVWLIDGRARPDHKPDYQDSMKMMGLTKPLGDLTNLEIPDPNQYRKFITVSQIRGNEENVTTQLVGRYPLSRTSTLLKLAIKSCPYDVQLHFGLCQDPQDFNTFEKVMIFEDATTTTYGTEDLGALESGEQSQINETGDVSASEFYEVVPLVFYERAETIVTVEVVDVVYCDRISCGDCAEESDGCQQIYAVTKAAGGSPGTPADVVYSLDGGKTWAAHDVDTLATDEDASGIACVGDYIVVISNASASMHIALKSDFVNGNDPAFTEVTTGFVAGGEPNAIWSVGNKAYIVGDLGYIYKIDGTPAAGVTVIDDGTVTTSNLIDIHMANENLGVIGGNDGVFLLSENGDAWTRVTIPIGIGTSINAVWAKTEKELFFGTSAGALYYTVNQGTSWTAIAFLGTNPSAVTDIAFSSKSVAYVTATVSSVGNLYRSISGIEEDGLVAMPRNQSLLPSSTVLNAVATCHDDVNTVVAVGADSSDGVIIVGEPSES